CGLSAFENLFAGSGLQYKREYTAAIRIVLNPDLSVMCFDDCFADREAKSNALSGHFLAVFHLVKFQEDLVFMFIGNTGTGIRHGQNNSLGAGANAGNDVTVSRRKLQSIFVEVSDDLYNAIAIALGECGGEIAVDFETNVLLTRLNVEFIDDAFDYRNEIM